MDCPVCKLTNPKTAIRCDCGYDFQKGEAPADAEARHRAAIRTARRQVKTGIVLLLAGIAITLMTTLAAGERGGGIILFAFGALAAGLGLIAHGWSRRRGQAP